MKNEKNQINFGFVNSNFTYLFWIIHQNALKKLLLFIKPMCSFSCLSHVFNYETETECTFFLV